MKILGMANAVIGDIIMSLPMLTYFEKKYKNSYKYFLIEKKCSQATQLFINHPLIDRIKITDNWDSYGESDSKIASQCDIVMPNKPEHTDALWYNTKNCIVETAEMRGIFDLEKVLTEEEMFPKLYKWFDVGLPNVKSTYSKEGIILGNEYHNNISIWPFAGTLGRSPSPEWWSIVVDRLIDEGYSVCHYGMPNDPILSNRIGYYTHPQLSYFDQVKAALASRITIGTDSGAMWVMGAYSHPAINLMTNWLDNHHSNFMALKPVNKNGFTFFAEGGCDNIPPDLIVDNVKKRAIL
jgi:ADP-heptose:LPS heptosyltransferase